MSALFLKASASKQVLGSWPASANRVTTSSAARAAVPQWPKMRPSGRTTRLGPPPHRPKHPHDFTITFGGATPERVSRVWNEPCLRQLRLQHTRISISSASCALTRQPKRHRFSGGDGARWPQRSNTLCLLLFIYCFNFKPPASSPTTLEIRYQINEFQFWYTEFDLIIYKYYHIKLLFQRNFILTLIRV